KSATAASASASSSDDGPFPALPPVVALLPPPPPLPAAVAVLEPAVSVGPPPLAVVVEPWSEPTAFDVADGPPLAPSAAAGLGSSPPSACPEGDPPHASSTSNGPLRKKKRFIRRTPCLTGAPEARHITISERTPGLSGDPVNAGAAGDGGVRKQRWLRAHPKNCIRGTTRARR